MVIRLLTIKMYYKIIKKTLIWVFDIPLKSSFQGLQFYIYEILNQNPFGGILNSQSNKNCNFATVGIPSWYFINFMPF
jgi:hypothetical protein